MVSLCLFFFHMYNVGLCGALVEVGDIQDFPVAQANQFNQGFQPRIRFSVINIECVL